jgi:hypothetical protein
MDEVKKTYAKIKKLYKDLPENELKLYDELFQNMAKLIVCCKMLWADIEENGATEVRVWGETTSIKPREVVTAYTSQCKLLAGITKQLDDKLPGKAIGSGFSKLMDD